jgi:hypothetical protein
VPLYVAESRVELNVRLKRFGEEQLQFHGLSTSIVKNYFLSVELIIDHNVEVVLGLGHVDGYIHTVTEDVDRDRIAVVLVV